PQKKLALSIWKSCSYPHFRPRRFTENAPFTKGIVSNQNFMPENSGFLRPAAISPSSTKEYDPHSSFRI
ncbi:MAG: hypothetical protein ABSF29_05990, partial [Tepidisphaeraceae bacterium]